MATSILLMLLALGVLIAGAEALVRGGSALAVRLGISTLFVGLTIVAFGTSAPELATGIASVLRGAGDLSVGNVIGANVFNIAVILGIAAIISPIAVHLPTVAAECRWVILAALFPLAGWFFGGALPRWFGAVMVATLVVFVVRAYLVGRAARRREPTAAQAAGAATGESLSPKRSRVWLELLLVAAGLAMLVGGSTLLVESAVGLARRIGVSDLVIGLTIVSFGTASPEMVTSVIAAYRGRSEIAVGNILGSNIFNILGILGVTTLIEPRTLSPQTLRLDAPVMLLVSLSLLPIISRTSRIGRSEGLTLVGIYFAYLLVVLAFAPKWFG